MNNTENIAAIAQMVYDQIGSQLVPPIVFMVILLLIGVPGNLTVLLIYKQKYEKCVYRTIIWNLAVADLSFCAVGISFNIGRIVHYHTFTSVWTCKAFTTFLVFGIMYSTHLLMLLSLHRFRQICMPLRTQITIRNVHRWIVGCFVIAVLLCIPQGILIEIENIDLGFNVTGTTCPVTPSNTSIYWKINNMTIFIMFMIFTISLLVMYIVIGRQIYLQNRKFRTGDHEHMQTTFSRKMTKIALTISVIFAASYLSLFFLKMVKHALSEDGLTALEFSLWRIAERLYMVNHVANPFVYAIFDNRFMQHLRELTTFKYRFHSLGSATSSTPLKSASSSF